MNDYYILLGLKKQEVKIIDIKENEKGIIEVEIENKHKALNLYLRGHEGTEEQKR